MEAEAEGSWAEGVVGERKHAVTSGWYGIDMSRRGGGGGFLRLEGVESSGNDRFYARHRSWFPYATSSAPCAPDTGARGWMDVQSILTRGLVSLAPKPLYPLLSSMTSKTANNRPPSKAPRLSSSTSEPPRNHTRIYKPSLTPRSATSFP
jgi:hypothetical protein